MLHFENSSQAIYLQIVEYICEQIVRGILPKGEKVPSVRELAVSLEVNPNTVMRSYDVLKQEAIIFDKRGIGSFITEDGDKKALRYLQKEFTGKTLPQLFKTMVLLNLSIKDLQAPFTAFKKDGLT